MKIVISSGHGKYIRGASGFLDEVDEARRVVETVADDLRLAGVDVVTFHDDVSDDQSENLNRIVDFHNSKTRDLDVSVHFNAYEQTSKPMGTEVLYVTQESLAAKTSSALASALSLPNRGAKYRGDLFFLNNTEQPSVLIETCFVDSSADADAYGANYDAACEAIAESLSGQEVPDEGRPPPDKPQRPPPPDSSTPSSRPTIARGDSGFHVVTVQRCLLVIPIDGDFGKDTEDHVEEFQRFWDLDVDGVVGPQTWAKLESEFDLPAYPPALPPGLDTPVVDSICKTAMESAVATHSWNDRGQAPPGYTQGMALAYSTALRKLLAGDPAAVEMAKANTGDSDTDVLAWYADEFHDLGWGDGSEAGTDNLRHLFAVLMGLGMRESSGQHCCGRDTSADNVTSDTAEAGLHQTSWNISTSSDTIQGIFDQYKGGTPLCYLHVWNDGVSCSESEWACYGSGAGFEHQMMSKSCPQYHVEVTAVGLRCRRQHWGPINRREVELLEEADEMFMEVQEIVTATS